MEKRVSEQKSENPINEFRPAEGEVIPAFSIPLLRGKINHLDQESMVTHQLDQPMQSMEGRSSLMHMQIFLALLHQIEQKFDR